MACSHPYKGYWSRRRHPVTGNRFVVFNPSQGFVDDPVYVPCGKCITCRLAKSFEWSVRCTCESYFYKENYFLTLTYDNEHLPADRQLNRLHFQQFMKRLRWHFRGYTLKVFYCGEYGDKRNRPHYHAIIFGLPLAEKNYRLYPVNYSRKGNKNYVNDKITQLWGFGLVTIGSFSSSSASYVAQYTLKKAKYNSRCTKLVKPFIGMSLRMPIGYSFFEKYYSQLFIRDKFSFYFGTERVLLSPLRFFKRLLAKNYPYLYWKYVERPLRGKRNRLRVEQFLLRSGKSPDLASALDKKIINRYIKEQRLLRRLEERMDL